MLPGAKGDVDDDLCSDFSSGDELLQQALPVDDCDGNDPPDASKILLCPNEYLRHVRYHGFRFYVFSFKVGGLETSGNTCFSLTRAE